MSADPWQQMWAIFERASELPLGEREAYLAQACGEDLKLRRTVDELLAADQDSSVLDQPAVPPGGIDEDINEKDPSPLPPTFSEEIPKAIGPYRPLRRLGQGGMGIVFLAERADDAFKRRVVIKLVRPGLERPDLLKRLRAEREILAGLDHPGIARLLDGGTTNDGLPYLVMEFVDGEPIDVFCDQNRLSIPDRLRLLRKVCDAVAYAHRNLVVHRDLKPSNLFVTADGEPKLLDFGVAKVLNPALLAPDMEPTAPWHRALTPSYASPEQLRGGPITTTSDVYSLGVLSYKLLTGRLPRRLEGRSAAEIERDLTRTEAPRPSSALFDAELSGQQTTASIAAARATKPDELARQLEGDLDAILLKALRVSVLERFASIESFSEDLGRYLEGQPVTARRGTKRYRAVRFLRRHRTATVAAVGTLLALLLLSAAMAWQSARIAKERDVAKAERDAGENILQLMLEIFRVADPFSGDGAGETLTVRDALDRSGPLLEQRLRKEPEQRAKILQATGSIYRNLGLLDDARERLEGAVRLRKSMAENGGPEHIAALTTLADVALNQGRGEDALEIAQEAVALARAEEVNQQEASATPLLAPLSGLVGVLCSLQEYEQAEPLALEAMSLAEAVPPTDPARPVALIHLAAVRNGQERYEEAVELYRQALALQKSLLGDSHPSLAVILNNLGIALRRLDRLKEAAQVMGEVLDLQSATLGEQHPRLVRTLNNLGGIAEARGEFLEARVYFDRALELLSETSGADHPRAFFLRVRIHRCELRLGNAEAVEMGLRKDLAAWRDRLGNEHRFIRSADQLLAESLVVQGRLDEAEGLQIELLEIATEEQRAELQEGFRKLYHDHGYPERAARFHP